MSLWGSMFSMFRGDFPKPDEMDARIAKAVASHSEVQADAVRTMLDGIDRTERVRSTVRGALARLERKNAAHG